MAESGTSMALWIGVVAQHQLLCEILKGLPVKIRESERTQQLVEQSLNGIEISRERLIEATIEPDVVREYLNAIFPESAEE